jgi:hypothetical protein
MRLRQARWPGRQRSSDSEVCGNGKPGGEALQRSSDSEVCGNDNPGDQARQRSGGSKACRAPLLLALAASRASAARGVGSLHRRLPGPLASFVRLHPRVS